MIVGGAPVVFHLSRFCFGGDSPTCQVYLLEQTVSLLLSLRCPLAGRSRCSQAYSRADERLRLVTRRLTGIPQLQKTSQEDSGTGVDWRARPVRRKVRTMSRSNSANVPAAELCCDWCRQPVSFCRASSCDDAGTYVGLPSTPGRWAPVDSAPARGAAGSGNGETQATATRL